ncbi:ATP-binding cassette ATPase Uup [Echinimonas agarilytica]|uniref:ATP-binding protein Uup n=1 Tax=Echinimonas agarilytica TaxID=1215918 RepID=A0AA41WB66_9GAMM|nr:ATP-binding cassette domain-containing protein [Echinimonas agarilytica]MCM2681171.1 ATP-binding cassette domain-containing protein [Echinimonas agarilytica]
MTILSLNNASLAFGHTPLLDRADLQIAERERLCIVGRNGTGKSTLMKVIKGDILLDDGAIKFIGTPKIAYLPQDPPTKTKQDVLSYVLAGEPKWQAQLSEYDAIIDKISDDPAAMRRFETLQSEMEVSGAWQGEMQAKQAIQKLDLEPDMQLSSLSGGWLRRAALAQALVTQPNILLLDEPTNHLDIDAIKWLEQFLVSLNITLIFISHDRQFIRSMATRIIDLDRGQLVSFPGNYDAYVEGKAKLIEEEERNNALFDKKLAEEEVWIRQGIKARRTRNEGRVRALEELRKQRKARLNKQGTARGKIAVAEASSKIVFELQNIVVKQGEQLLIDRFESLIQKGDRLALVGPNGCGKSTLIKTMLGDHQDVDGVVKRAQNLEVAYFDQHRAQLPPEATVADFVGDGKQQLEVNGKPRHVLGYLQDFLFSPARARSPISALSGGEKNRLLLAKLFLKPSNLLVLDEPTNDLDIETLDLLEELVCNYAGTILLVSHDREFVNRVATSCWLFEGEGVLTEIYGGFNEINQYLEQKVKKRVETPVTVESKSAKPVNKKQNNKLSFKLKLELEELPDRILKLETDLENLQQQVNSAEFFTLPQEQTAPILEQLTKAQAELDVVYARWDELEELSNTNKD